ncbi:MAG: hypothetical protein P1U87_05885 [Verrucomicrobiales bacterium]|nr:hypothetical protein [Verrucomicrobiales bacterium]
MTVEELYLEALECSVDELSVFLDFACADDSRLRVDVEEMLGNTDPVPEINFEEDSEVA